MASHRCSFATGVLLCAVVFALAGCGAGDPQDSLSPATTATPTASPSSSVVVSEAPAPTTTKTPTTSTTPPRPSTSSEDEAVRVLSGDLTALTPELVREAGLALGGHRYGLPFAKLYASGDREMRDAVADVLGIPTPANAQLLVGFAAAKPSPDFAELAWWDDWPGRLHDLRDEVLDAVFGERAGIAEAAMRYVLVNLEGSEEAWFDLPAVVNRVEGELDGNTFEGVFSVASDTGELSEYAFIAEGNEWGTWVVTSVSPALPERVYNDPAPRPAWFTHESLVHTGFAGSRGAGGSGCAPGTEELPDGAWFGSVTERTSGGITFDMMCWWSGAMANKVAFLEGSDEIPVPNDYMTTNASNRLRELVIEDDVPVYPVDVGTDSPTVVSFDSWPLAENWLGCQLGGEYDFCIVWVYVNNGVITEISEQYVP